MALAPTATKVRNLGADLDEGRRLCYPGGPPEYSVLAHVERAGKARLDVGQNPVLVFLLGCNPMSEH
jgi:hypothetical protein